MRNRIETTGEVRKVFSYDRRSPGNGNLLTAWYEHTELTGDDMEAGKPDPGHGYYLVNEWQCGTPARATGVEGCASRPGPTYSTDIRHVVDHDYDKKLNAWVDVDKLYEYDDDGDALHSNVRTTSPDKIETVDTVSTFGAAGQGDWRRTRELTREAHDTTATLDKDKLPGAPTKIVTHTLYERDARGRLVRETVDDGGTTTEVTAAAFEDDLASPDFGRLLSITVSHVGKAGGTLEDLRTVHVGYSADGYFATSFKSGDKDEKIEEHDPVSGKLTKEVKDGVTTISTYDGFGRITSQEIRKPDKPVVSVKVRYEACSTQCPANAVYERIDDWSDKTQRVIFYNMRDEALNDPYK